MIQRIQTVYLFVAFVVTIVLLFIPIGYIYTPDSAYVFTCFNVKLIPPMEGVLMNTLNIALILIVSACMSLYAIFKFKDRMKQSRIVSFNMLVFLIAIVMMIWIFPDYIFKRNAVLANSTFRFNKWIMIFVLPPVAMFLANRAIRNDEKKVRAADRLR